MFYKNYNLLICLKSAIFKFGFVKSNLKSFLKSLSFNNNKNNIEDIINPVQLFR